MNRNFENRKPTKVYAKSKENQMIIKALNMYGRVPEQYELLEEIEKLNNIINGMEKFFQYAYDNEVRPLNDRKVSVWTICLDKLQELKGSDSDVKDQR